MSNIIPSQEQVVNTTNPSNQDVTTAGTNSNGNVVVFNNNTNSNNGLLVSSSMRACNKKSSGGPIFKYIECQKNHAARIGGNATDGCGEFMAGGEEGTLEALTCAACNCHRNFHRKIIHHYEYYEAAAAAANSPCCRPFSPPEGPVLLGGGHRPVIKVEGGAVKKRFRTKFTQEQKDKMFNFATKSGWKIQKLDDSEVANFCQEIGIKRNVIKVWMHNNKYHQSAKKKTITAPPPSSI